MSLLITDQPEVRRRVAPAPRREARLFAGRLFLLAWARRVLGAAMIVLATAPVYRLLVGRETGLAGEATAATADLNYAFLWSGTLLVLGAAILTACFLSPAQLERATTRARMLLLAPRLATLALAAAATTVVLSCAFSLIVMDGKPTVIDAVVQLLHARYLAAGRLSGPAVLNEFWHLQNSVITPHGWVSQYPPGHALLLAIGFRAGAVWAVGPMLAGFTVLFTMLAAVRLLPDRPATARIGGLLLAVSPFIIVLAGSFMNHITSAALFAMALYCSIRARDERAVWAIPAGAALAYALAVRPLSAVAVGGSVCVIVWLPSFTRAHVRSFIRRIVLAGAGGAPMLAAMFAYNAHFFGSPTRWGYQVALGPATNLGFHRDPWGNFYGPIEALAYTASDLHLLGTSLLETPLSAVVLVGLYLLFARKLAVGARVFAAWALVAVVANAFYWHHGIHMGPRMLLEAAPGWIILTAIAGVDLAGRIVPAGRQLNGRISMRCGVAGGLAFALLLAALVLVPQRLRSYKLDDTTRALTQLPEVDRASLVFVHGAWASRVAMRLAAAGIRLDTVETLLRQNSTCFIHTLSSDLVSADAQLRARAMSRLDVSPRSTGLPPQIEIAPGSRIRALPGEQLTEACLREARSDDTGVLDIAPFVWRGDMPGVPGGGPLFVRDLGPEANARLIAAIPERTPYLLHASDPEKPWLLLPYRHGMATLWGDPEATTS